MDRAAGSATRRADSAAGRPGARAPRSWTTPRRPPVPRQRPAQLGRGDAVHAARTCRAPPAPSGRAGACSPRSSAVRSGVVTRTPVHAHHVAGREVPLAARRTPAVRSASVPQHDALHRRQDLQLAVVEDVHAVQPGRRPVDEDGARALTTRPRRRCSGPRPCPATSRADVDVAEHPAERPASAPARRVLCGGQPERRGPRQRVNGSGGQVRSASSAEDPAVRRTPSHPRRLCTPDSPDLGTDPARDPDRPEHTTRLNPTPGPGQPDTRPGSTGTDPARRFWAMA